MARSSPAVDALGDGFSWSLLDATPDAVFVVGPTGEIVFLNSRAGEMFGYRLDDLLGRPIEHLVPEDVRAVHRAHRTRYRAEPTRRPMGAGLVLRARRSDGREFPVEISLSPMSLGDETFSVAAVRDVTDRMDAEDYLRRVLSTLDASDDGVFIFDAATLKYSYVNDGAVRLVGYNHDELTGMTPLHLDPHASSASYRELIDQLQEQEGKSVNRQSLLLRKDGQEVPVEETFQTAPIGRDGSLWVIVLARGIAARLRAEEELRHSQEALRDAARNMAVADDRERIARDLHDTVIQRLFGSGMKLQATMSISNPEVQSRLSSTIEDLDETIKELRMAIFSLQGAAAAAPGGVRGRIVDVAIAAAESLGFDPRVQFDGPIESIDERVIDELVPSLREALSNIARHAKASSARIRIVVDEGVEMTITDNGIGVPDQVLGGRGLENILERARQVGGDAHISALADGGTQVVWVASLGETDPDLQGPSAEDSPALG